MKIKDTIGIDISKLTFDVRIHSNQMFNDFENTTKGFKQLVDWVNSNNQFSKNQMDLFKCGATYIHRIVVKIPKKDFNFLEGADYKWFLNNPTDSKITYFQALKKYDKERNTELFDLIKKGSRITKGELYKTILLQIN